MYSGGLLNGRPRLGTGAGVGTATEWTTTRRRVIGRRVKDHILIHRLFACLKVLVLVLDGTIGLGAGVGMSVRW